EPPSEDKFMKTPCARRVACPICLPLILIFRTVPSAILSPPNSTSRSVRVLPFASGTVANSDSPPGLIPFILGPLRPQTRKVHHRPPAFAEAGARHAAIESRAAAVKTIFEFRSEDCIREAPYLTVLLRSKA